MVEKLKSIKDSDILTQPVACKSLDSSTRNTVKQINSSYFLGLSSVTNHIVNRYYIWTGYFIIIYTGWKPEKQLQPPCLWYRLLSSSDFSFISWKVHDYLLSSKLTKRPCVKLSIVFYKNFKWLQQTILLLPLNAKV